MDNLIFLEKQLGKNKISINEPLSAQTTFKIGGIAEYFYRANSIEDLIKAIYAATFLKINYYILGSGSNVLISDNILSGLTIKNESRTLKITKSLGKVKKGNVQVEKALVEVDSGVLVNQFVRFTCDEGLQGLERHLGLPGTVGGAIYNNSKWTKPLSYFGDNLYQAQILTPKGDVKTVDRTYFKFDYDYSILQKTHEILLKATFILKKEDKKILWEIANNSAQYRHKSQPIGVKTAGCVFKNISLSQSMKIGTPQYTQSAGYLLDQVGLKNFQIGNAKFSDHHANFIINLGGATAQNVMDLIHEAKSRVKQKFGINLELEIIRMGEFN